MQTDQKAALLLLQHILQVTSIVHTSRLLTTMEIQLIPSPWQLPSTLSLMGTNLAALFLFDHPAGLLNTLDLLLGRGYICLLFT